MNYAEMTSNHLRKSSLTAFLLSLALLITGCSSPDPMPNRSVDVFILDLSTSNDKDSQLIRLDEDLLKSLTENGLGVPKPLANENASGAVTTIFSFIEDVALKAETFKLQDAESAVNLWNDEFAKDRERNARSWADMSSVYNAYLKQSLKDPAFSINSCNSKLDQDLSDKFVADTKRARIVRVLCEKIQMLNKGYAEMRTYVSTTVAPATDIFGMLAKVDRLVDQIHTDNPTSVVTVNIGSDMQHETGDGRDTPGKLKSINFERARACEMGKQDRAKEGLTFDQKSKVKVNGIGNANIGAEYGNALVAYWQCFFDQTAEIR
ncbi:hypothetical protein MCEMRE193_00914 [Candidatus Nanopelagicaceae bacterium]